MVAVVSGNSLGLFNSSLAVLGSGGAVGNSPEGRSGERIFVNSATGNLVVQSRDEVLAATGLDLALVRTYNSQGLLNDDNGDNWRLGVHQRVFNLTGTVNTAGSTVTKTFGDGADVVYTYNATLGVYLSNAGDGAHDTLAWSAGTSQWTWTDGSARNTETYDSTGRLLNSKDADGNTITYSYTGNLLTQVADASGQTTFLDYTGNNLTQIRVVSQGQTQTITRYTYDGQNRLSQVRVDLSPADNSIADNNVYLTTYTYEGTSTRIASISQGSNATVGSTVNFTYELVGSTYLLKTFVDGESKVTTFTYTLSGGTTLNANPATLSTTENVSTPYNLNSGLLTVPSSGAWTTPLALESSSNAASLLTVARATSGNAIAAWAQGGQVFARVYTASTQTWATATTLSGSSATIANLRLSVDAASGNAIVTWTSNGNNVRVNRYVSSAWAGNESLGTPTPTVSEVSGSINGNGVAAVSWLETSGSTRTIRIRRRTGSSWATAETVFSQTAAISTPQVQVLSNNNIQVVWRRANSGVERLYTRGHNGSSWSTTPQLSPAGTSNVTLYSSDKSGTTAYAGWVQGNNIYVRSGSLASWGGSATLLTTATTTVTGLAFAGAAYTTSAVAFTTSDGNVWVKRVGQSAVVVGTGTSLSDINIQANQAGDLIVRWRANGVLNATAYVGGAWAAPEAIEEVTGATPLYLFIDPLATELEDDKALAVFTLFDGTANSIFAMRYTEDMTPYYAVQAGDTWASIGALLYGNSAVAAQLQTALGNPALTPGAHLTGFPSTITVVTTVTVAPYYNVLAGDTWTTITQTVYGSSVAAAVTALQNAVGNPTLTTGLHITMPASIAYGGSGVSTQTDIATPLGLQTRLVNDSSGRLTAVLSPTVGGIRLEIDYGYDADGNVTTIIEDPTGLNRVTTNTYDANGNLTLTRDSLGNTVTRTYNSANQLVTETSYVVPDPDGAGAGQPSGPMTARFAYDSESHLRFSVTGEGRVTDHRYNAAGQRTAAIRYTGGVYDVSGLSPTTVLTEAQLTTWTGTQNLTQTERTDYLYDFRGNLTSATAYAATDGSGNGLAAGSSITRYVYDQRGRLLSTIDPRGEATPGDPNDYSTTFTYDGLGRLLTSVRWTATGNVTASVSAYNDGTRTNTVTLANGLVTTTTSDRVGRVLTVNASAGASLGTTTYTYDIDGRLRMVTDPIGVRSHIVYDAAGRKIFTVDGDGTLTELIYDRVSNVVKTVEYAVAANTALVVDAGGVPIVNVDTTALRNSANGQSTQNRISRAVYDASHRVVFTVDIVNVDSGSVVKNVYDGASRLTDSLRYATPVTVAASVNELVYSPSGGGSIVGVTITTSADDRLSRIFYDNEGRALGTLDGAGYLTKNVYNGAGELIQTIAYSGATQVSLRATGTFAQLLASITLDASKDIASYAFYDGQGRRIGAIDGLNFFTQWTYDAAGNVAQEIRYPNAVSFTGMPTYAGTLPGSTTGAHITGFEYNEQSRVTRVTNFEGTITEHKYDSVGNLTQTTTALGADPRVTQTRYDALGRVTAELTAEGSVALAALGGSPTQPQIDAVWNDYGVKYAYDLAGRRISTTDQYGNVTLFYYDADRRVRFTVVKVEGGWGEVAELRYNALGQVTERRAYAPRVATAGLTGGDVPAALANLTAGAADSVTTYSYTLAGRVATETTAEGGSVTTVYNAFGELFTSTQLVEGATSLEHRYTYDQRGMLLTTRWDPNGLNTTETRVYDAFGRVTQVTDPRGNIRTMTYDRLGRTVQVTDPLLKNSFTSYDSFSRVLTTTDRLNNVTQYVYNDTTRSVVITTPESLQVTTVGNRHGQTATITDARGNVTSYEYDVNGQLKRVFDALGNQSQQTYDRAGRAIDSIDANGVITRLAYDAASRVFTRTVNPGGLNLVTTYAYDGRGQTISTTDERGVVTDTEYTRDGQVKKVTVRMGGVPADDLVTTFTYDKRGALRVTTQVDVSNPHVVTYEYDVLGRRTREIVSLGSGQNAITQYRYDQNGNLTRKIDARYTSGSEASYSTWYVYDANDRLRYTLDALGGVTQTTYDDEARVTSTRRHATPTSTAPFVNDNVVTLTELGTPATSDSDRLEETVYDRDGRVRYKIDALEKNGTTTYSVVTELQYDGNGNVVYRRAFYDTLEDTSGNPVARTPQAINAALTPNTALDRESYHAYDVRNRVTVDIDSLGGATRYTYDANGNVVTRTELAASVPMDGVMRLWFVPATNSSASQYLGKFSTGDVVTATVRFKAPADTSGMMFLGDAGGPNPYDNATQTAVTYGNDGWQTLTATWTMTHEDDMWVYIYGDRDGAFANPSHSVLYDNVEVRSVQRGTVLDDRFENVPGAWSISGLAQPQNVTLLDAGSAGAVDAFVTSLADPNRDRITRYWYDAAGRNAYVLDAESYVTEKRYTDATRTEESFGYANKMLGITGSSTLQQVGTTIAANLNAASDRYTKTEYDRGGRVAKITDAYNNYELFTYDEVGNRLTYRNQKGDIWTYAYDANHRLTDETSPAVPITTVGPSGSTLAVTDQTTAAIVTHLTYDVLGNVLTRTEAYGRAEARTTTYEYDLLGRQWHTIFPAISVYSPAAGDELLAGAAVTRVETTVVPDTVVTYNTLGDAVVNRDVAGNYSHRIYDRLGRVIYEVDPIAPSDPTTGYVTEHRYDVFGNETQLIRYANALNTSGFTLSAEWLAIQITPSALPPSPASDRTVTTQYDRLNRAKQVTQPSVHNFLPNSGGTPGGDVVNAGAATLFEYNAFGDVTRQRQLVDTSPLSYADTYFYYDRRGLRTASVDPLGFLAVMEYGDGTRALTRQVEYANAIAWWNTAGYASPAQVPLTYASNPTDTIANGVTVIGDSMIKETGGDTWNGGFRSKVGYTGGATVTFTVPRTDKGMMVGLNSDPMTDNSYPSIDWAIYPGENGYVYVYESGAGYIFGTYSAGDTFSVTYDGSRVIYAKNGETLRSVTASIAGPLYADSSFYSVGGRVDNFEFQQAFFTERLTLSGATARKTAGPDGWNSELRSKAGYVGGATVAYTVAQNNKYLMVGLNSDPAADASYGSLDYAIYNYADGNFYVYESGSGAGYFGTYVAGDRFRVTYDGGKVQYFKNGVVFREVVAAIAGPLYADSSFHDVGGEIKDIEFGRSAADRDVAYTYDKLGRLKTESLTIDGDGGLTRELATTTHDYDAVGNRTVSTDPAGATSYTYYDKLGRVEAIAAPQRDVDGSATTTLLTPLITMDRDAHGNLVRQIQWAGNASAGPGGYALPSALPGDRATLIQVDRYNNVLRTVDGEGGDRQASYNVRSEVAKEWQIVTNTNDNTTDAIVTIYKHDALGRQTEIVQPARLGTSIPVVKARATYNSFGEITNNYVNDVEREYFDYDQAGRVWRSNAGDGVDTVHLYDLLGNTTGEIRSQSVNLRTLADAATALALAGGAQMRVETRYDLKGNAIEQREVTFSIDPAQEAIGATISFGDVAVPVPSNAIYQQVSYNDPYQGTVTYYYANPVPYSQGGGYYQVEAPSASNNWQGVYARVAESEYQLLQRGHLLWNAPSEQGLTKKFEYLLAGNWTELTVKQISPTQLGVDISGVTSGGYEYKVSYIRSGDTVAFAIATGTFSVSNSGVTTLSSTAGNAVGSLSGIGASLNGTNVTMTWSGAYDPAVNTTLEVKPTSSGTWQVAVGQYSSSHYAIVSSMTAGTYDYRITHLRNGMTEAIAIGTLTVTSSSSSTTGVASPAQNWGNAVAPLAASTSGSPGGNTSVGISWTATGYEEVFRYRPAGGNWVYPSAGGGYSANIGPLAAGTYEWYHEYGYNDIYSSWVSLGVSSGQFVVQGTSSYLTTNPGSNGVAVQFYSSTPPDVITTTLAWAIDSSIAGTPQFYYRTPGGSWTQVGVGVSGPNYYASIASLNGTYDWKVEYWVYDPGNPPYQGPTSFMTANATGQFTVSGTSAQVISQTGSPSYLSGVSTSGSNLTWARAIQSGESLTVTLNGSPLTPQTSNGTNYTASFNGVTSGFYPYEIAYWKSGAKYVVGSGYLSVTTNVTPATATPSAPSSVGQIAGFYDAGNRRLAWTTAAAGGASVTFRYRNVGGSTWTTPPLTPFAYNGAFAVDLPPTASGQIEYEIQYTASGAHSPYMIGKGTTTINVNVVTSGSATDTTSSTLTPIIVTPRMQQKYDRWGQVIEATDAALATTNYRYDQRGHVIEVKNPVQAVLSTIASAVVEKTTRPTQRNYYDLAGRLVATRDGNGNLNRVQYNAAGQGFGEAHADGGQKSFVLDAFGQQIQVTDELGFRTRMAYDHTGNLTAVVTEIVAGGFASATPSDLTPASGTSTVRMDYTYDKAGRRIAETSGELMADNVTPETTKYWYDLRGNVIRRRSPKGRETLYEYDQHENKTLERNPNAADNTLTWSYDAFGRVQTQTDLGGATTTYAYDPESKYLASQTSTIGQNINYTYDAAGHVTSIVEDSNETQAAGAGLQNILRTTEYDYDSAGRRARERVVIDGLEHQDTHILYDEQSRIYQLSDLRYRTTYRYDGAGNRSQIVSTYYNHAGVQKSDDLWYTYDAMNRVKVSQGVNASGTVAINSAQGIELTYDLKGQRTSARQFGQKLIKSETWGGDIYNPVQVIQYSYAGDYSTETYGYDGLGRLLTTDRSTTRHYQPVPGDPTEYTEETTTRIDTRTYDKASRELTSETLEFVGNPPLTPVARSRETTYEDDGRTVTQLTRKDGVKESYAIFGDSTYVEPGTYYYFDPFTGQPVEYSWGGWGFGFDAAGTLRSYLVHAYDTNTSNPDDVAYTSTFALSHRNGQTYQEVGTVLTSDPSPPGPQSGSTSRFYNVNGELVSTTDSREPSRNRYFANDANGQAITVVQGQFDGQSGRWTHQLAFQNALSNIGGYNTTKSQHFFNALGKNVGSFGQLSENGEFTANFDVNYTPVSASYPASAPAQIVTQQGDTLRILAARVWGDANLWYLIAEANGLTDPDAAIEPGMVIRVPNDVVSASNVASSFKPFDAREAIGDTTPFQPDPPMPPVGKNGCGALGMILIIVVVIVVSVVSYGALTGPAVGWGAGAAGAAAGTAFAGAGGVLAAGAVAGAAASVAGQMVGMATGMQDKFSWSQVALGALGGAVGGAVSSAGALGNAINSGIQNAAVQGLVRGAVSSAITQGIAVVTGLQDKFSWRDVVIGAAAGAATSAVDNRIPDTKRAVSGLATSFTGSAVRVALGGKVDIATVIGDAFGNAIGNKLAEQQQGRFAQRQRDEDMVSNVIANFNAENSDFAERLFPLPEPELPALDNNPRWSDGPVISPDGAGDVYVSNLLYRRGVDDPLLQRVGAESQHYYLPAIVGARFIGAGGLTGPDVEEIIRFSQLPDETRLFDALANGVRFYLDEDPFGNRTPEAEIGRVKQQSLHALNGLTVQENVDRYFQIIRENRTDWAVVGFALHGLVDSVYHADTPNGFAAFADLDQMRTYDEPYGHALPGKEADFPTWGMARRVAGLVTQAFEIITGVSSQGYARGTTTPIGLNIAVDLNRVLEAGDVETYRRTPESEGGFIRAAAGLLPRAVGTLNPEQHDLANSLSLSERPTWNVRPITWQNSVTETQGFLRSDRATAERFLARGSAASNLITNDFIRARGIEMAPLTPLRHGQVSQQVLEERRAVTDRRVQELIEEQKRLP